MKLITISLKNFLFPFSSPNPKLELEPINLDNRSHFSSSTSCSSNFLSFDLIIFIVNSSITLMASLYFLSLPIFKNLLIFQINGNGDMNLFELPSIAKSNAPTNREFFESQFEAGSTPNATLQMLLNVNL